MLTNNNQCMAKAVHYFSMVLGEYLASEAHLSNHVV